MTTIRLPSAVLLLALTASASAADTLPPLPNVASPEPGVITAGRISGDDLDALRTAGVREIIDLTPDAETPTFDERAVVTGAGFAYANLPLQGGADLTRDNVLAFDAMLNAAQRPVLVHCASSNRVGAMAALRAAWVDGASEEEAIAIGRAWGLKSLEADVRKKLAAASGTDSNQR